jgi:hypothetical protein
MAGIIKQQLDGSDYYIIELQGDLKTDDEILDGMHIGTLEGTTLNIGNHILKGQLVDISPPLHLTRREGRELIVIAKITKRLIFSERPTPIPSMEQKKPKTNAFFKPK